MENENSKKGLVDEIKDQLCMDKGLHPEILKSIRGGIVTLGEATGDTDAEDVLNNCLIEFKRLKDPQSKAMIMVYLLGTLPIELQKYLTENHEHMIIASVAEHLKAQSEEPSGVLAKLAALGILKLGDE